MNLNYIQIKSLTIFSLLVAVIFACNPGPEGFTVNVHVTGISDGTIFYLKKWRDNVIIDSSYTSNGSFTFKGRISNPESFLLHATDAITKEFIYTNLLIGNENVTINADKKDFPWNIDAIGSESQDVAEKFNHIEYQRQELSKQPGSNTKNISDSLHNLKVKMIKENFNSYAALVNFKYYKDHFPTGELSDLYERLSPVLKQTPEGKAIKTQIDYPPPAVGSSYYDYTAVNQNGDTVSLSEITTKYILLHFSHAGCYYSQQSIPELKAIHERYNDKLEIVKISEDISKEDWKESIDQDSITWVNLWDGKGEYGDAVVKYGVIGTPNYILISPDKVIVNKWFGYSEGAIEEKLKAHM